MSTAVVEPLFIGTGVERRFAVLFSPPKGVRARGGLLFVPPFAEEMNKSRHVVAACARTLASKGWISLTFDPLGTGDSPGDFADASWDAWIGDLVRAHAWLSERVGTSAGLWSMRAGALLSSAALPWLGTLPFSLLWQPVLTGKAHLTQFLRLRVASESLASKQERTSTRSLLDQLARGERVEIAGYMLPPALALPMQQSELGAPVGIRKVAWVEVSSSTPAEMAPAGAAVVAKWRALGIDVATSCVAGAPFWQTQELEDCPALIAATVEASESADAGH